MCLQCRITYTSLRSKLNQIHSMIVTRSKCNLAAALISSCETSKAMDPARVGTSKVPLSCPVPRPTTSVAASTTPLPSLIKAMPTIVVFRESSISKLSIGTDRPWLKRAYAALCKSCSWFLMHKRALLVSLTMLKFQEMKSRMLMTHDAYLRNRLSITAEASSRSERPRRKTVERAPFVSFARLSLSRSESSLSSSRTLSLM